MDGLAREWEIYVSDMGRDHQGMRRRLSEVASALEQLAQSHSLAKSAVDQLTNLRNWLAEHFASEEQAGALLEARNYCPQVGMEVERIFAEHRQLLANLQAMLDTLQQSERHIGHGVTEICREFERFRTQMERHEEAENSVVARAFGQLPD
jgi:hemerythrin-like domain-containing protein